ncbi:MAG: hypothetical protein HYT15_00125 [Candidatus Magasanikbacteria bacterium]|nr:hypothetical protein [Candidatus Magasanikbacteria bacterium]
MTKKLLLVGLGAGLIVGGFFVGMRYRETPKDNTKNDVVKEESVPTLDSLLMTTNLYSVGESRTILSLKNIEARIALGFVYEVKTIMDQVNHLQYRIYRVGQGDAPPTYSEGRLFLQVIDSSNQPRYVWSMFDMQIDRVEPLGEVYVQGSKLIITCAKKQNIVPAQPCEYQVDFSSDTRNLTVIRSK